MRYIFAIILSLAIFIPSIAFAQGGIVPCGYGALPSCNLCHLYTGVKNIIDFMLFDLILPLATIALLIGGIFMLASMGNPQMLQTGKTAITNTIIGIMIAFGSWLIIATIVNTLGYEGFTAAWNEPPTCKASIAGTPPPPTDRKICVRKSPESCTPMENEKACLDGCNGGTCQTSCPAFKKFCVSPPEEPKKTCYDRGSEEECKRTCKVGTCQASCPAPSPAKKFCVIASPPSCTDKGSEEACTDGGCKGGECKTSCPAPSGGGTNAELIKKIQDQGGVFAPDSTGDCKGVNGKKVGPITNRNELESNSKLTTCFDGCKASGQPCYPPPDSRATSLDSRILPALEIASRSQNFTISSIATGDHSATSKHYVGKAVDIVPPSGNLRDQLLIACNNVCRAVIETTPPHIHVSWP